MLARAKCCHHKENYYLKLYLFCRKGSLYLLLEEVELGCIHLYHVNQSLKIKQNKVKHFIIKLKVVLSQREGLLGLL